MSSFFGLKKSKGIREGDPISLEALKQLIPIRNLSEDLLKSFALGSKSEALSAREVLFKINEEADAVFYLLKGTVSLSDGNTSYEIEATEAKAKFPLSSGTKYNTTATAKTEVNFLRVSQKIMSQNSGDQQTSFQIEIPKHLEDNSILQLFTQHSQDEDLTIPTLPNVALSLRKAMEKEIGINEAVKIIQLDPVISAKLIEVANCPLYFSSSPAKSCLEAVKKIGLNATQSLVVSLSLKNIFVSDSPLFKKHLNHLWKNSLQLSSLSFVLASITQQNNPEEAQLAGLICDIGAIPFLNFVADLPADFHNSQDIKTALPVIKGAMGATILQNWGFTEEFIQVPLSSEDWYQYSEGSLSYTDIVVLSRLHRKIEKKELAKIPPITSIPAASKLTDITLSPENSLNILHKAKNKINDSLNSISK